MLFYGEQKDTFIALLRASMNDIHSLEHFKKRR